MRKGEELKAPRHASVAATRDHVTTRNIFPIITKANLNKALEMFVNINTLYMRVKGWVKRK